MSKHPHLCLAIFTLFITICKASLTQDEIEKFLKAHNDARATVGVQPLQWSKKIASYASKLDQHLQTDVFCRFSKLNAGSSRYGTNQAVANVFDSPAMFVDSWVNEGRLHYNHNDSSCPMGYHDMCQNYKQVVWKSTVKLGCSKSNCGKDRFLISCFYYPRGNIPGEKPY